MAQARRSMTNLFGRGNNEDDVPRAISENVPGRRVDDLLPTPTTVSC